MVNSRPSSMNLKRVYSKSVCRGEAFAESCYTSRAIVRMPRPYTMSAQLILNTPE